MPRIGYDSPAGREFHGLAGDTAIYEHGDDTDPDYLRVDQMRGDNKVFIEVGDGGVRAYLPRAEMIRMAKAVLDRLEAK